MVAALRQALGEHESAVRNASGDAHTRADMRFHQIIRDASANPGLIGLLGGLQAQVRLAMVTTTVTAGPRRALADHKAIFAAIDQGDAEGAEREARAHIARLRRSLESAAERNQ